MNADDIRHILRRWIRYEGWEPDQDTEQNIRAIAEEILALPQDDE